jgi:hypothetical protein
MQREDWPEYWGRIIGATVSLGILSALAGLVWSLAVGFSKVAGAMWGGIIGAGITFVLSLGIGKRATTGMMMMFGGVGAIAIVIGLIVWLVRTLVG